MDKQSFLRTLRGRLQGLPSQDIEKSLEFYGEIIDDRIEEGLSEEDAVKSLGSIDEIVNQILSDTPIVKLVKEKVKPKRELSFFEIILIIISAPIWAPVFMSAISAIFSIYLTVWGLIVLLYSTVIVFALMSASLIIGALGNIGAGNIANGVFLIGSALVCVGAAMLLFISSNWITKGTIYLSKKIWIKLKSFFVGGSV